MSQNELFEYIEQLSLWEKEGDARITPLTFPSALVFSHLDWLSIRYPTPLWDPQRKDIRVPFPADLFWIDNSAQAAMGYARAATLHPSGIFYWRGHDKRMGSLMVLSGDDLALARTRLKLTDDELLRRLHYNAEVTTRLDFASNINTGSIGQLIAALQANEAKTKVRKALAYQPIFDEKNQGVRIGSKNSKKFIRVYDKAAELKLVSTILNRIELQTRKDVAENLTRAMLKHGVKQAGKSAIRNHCDFPSISWYQAALQGGELELQLSPRRRSSVMDWLENDVQYVLRKTIDKGLHHDQIRDWLHANYEYLTRGK